MHQPIPSPSQIILLMHLEAEKAKTLAWVAEDPENRWAGYSTTSIEHWAESGVYSVEQYDRYNMLGSLSDLSKDVYGFRMRYNTDIMTDAEMQDIYDDLLEQLQGVIEQEKHVEQEAIKEFEATVSRLMEQLGASRIKVIEWLMDAENADSNDYFCFCNDLPYGYIDKDIIVKVAA